ncbi:hypothetical protein F5884DRAFT_852724 [Xylogone sp. PMI_703]|nr:hypothetical protein F5884DRAFT_852724 [Xylogone sp. PMI_703]
MNQCNDSMSHRSLSPIRALRIHKQNNPPELRRGGESYREGNPVETSSHLSPSLSRTSSLYSSERQLSPEIFVEIPGQEKPSASTHHYSDPVRFTLHSSSDSTSTVMGDFIPIDYQDIKMHPLPEERDRVFAQLLSPRKIITNPYEFDPKSPDINVGQQTGFSGFKGRSRGLSSPRQTQISNSHSEANCLLQDLSSSNYVIDSLKAGSTSLQRSESSPNLTPGLFAARREGATDTSDLSQFSTRDKLERTLSRRGSQREGMALHRYVEVEEKIGSHPRGRTPAPTQRRTAKVSPSSPSRAPRGYPQDTPSRSSDYRHSITKELQDLAESDEKDHMTELSPILSWPPTPPPRRSRSPMKKMFGENGWLGHTPDLKDDQKITNSSGNIKRKDASLANKKTTMMGKIRNKLEEIAEKADMSPGRGHFRSESGKHAASSAVLSVSVGPPHQARMFMEMELMIVHTANAFLMNEFSHGRFVVETLKKTVDSWKRAGRAAVIEFMYDQATQRDLVAANQHNFRFHSVRPTDNVRVSSMLYNWKQVASAMAIRTFCAADTVILKLIFDIEQILELLGAGHPIMLRLQQIRAEVNEFVSLANKKQNNQQNSQSFQEATEANITASHGQSFNSYLPEDQRF